MGGVVTLTGDQSLLREINRMSLVRAILRESGVSRADLAKVSGLTKSTVSLLTQDLIEEGWLLEADIQATGAMGRRPTPLFLNDERLLMIGADVSVEHIYVLSVSLTGKIGDRLFEPLSTREPEEVIQRLAQMAAQLVLKSQRDGRRVLGVGVGVPGAILGRGGLVKLAPNLGWRDLPFLRGLTQALAAHGVNEIPVRVQNDCDAASLGEHLFGGAPQPDPLIYLGLGVGVGAGIVMRDQLYLGADGFAGEVGHMILQLDGPLCSCGRRGCAETFIGLRAVSTQVSGNANDLLPIAVIRQLVGRGDAVAELAVRRAGNYLAVLIQNLWACFNPGRVVVGGPVSSLGRALLDVAEAGVARYAAQCALPPPEIRLPRFGEDAIAVGAAAMILYAWTRPHDSHWRFA